MIPIKDNVPARRDPWMVYAIIAANVLVFLHEVGLHPVLLQRFIHRWGVIPAAFLRPDLAVTVGLQRLPLLTLFTSMFIHGGWLHIISNMWALWLFGDNVEDRLGHLRFMVFYVVCGVAAMFTHVLLSSGSTIPAVGASGAIAGVMGAYFLFYPFARMIVMIPIFFYPFFFELPAALYILVWAWSQLTSGTFTLLTGYNASGVAFWAHVGGFIAGMVLAPLACDTGRRPRCFADEYFPW